MLLSIVILLGLGTVAADFLFYRRRMADASPRARRLFLIAALATDLLPVVPMVAESPSSPRLSAL